MKNAATVLRHYSIADAKMRQLMRTMYMHYLENQAAFLAFNPELGKLFGTDWLAALDLSDTTPVHSVRVGELKEDTAAVEDTMEQGRRAVQTVFYYVGRAFPHNAGRLDKYGRRDYEAARKQHDKMRTLLDTAFASATRDKVALAAKGYTATQLAALGTLVDQMKDTNTTQTVQKGGNTEDAAHYVTVQNLAYGFGQEVSAASKVLFADDAAKLGLFQLTHTTTGLEHHELTVEPGHSKTVAFAAPLTEVSQLHLHLFLPEMGQQAEVGRVVVAGEAPTLVVTLDPGAADRDVTAPELGPQGQLLVVRNAGEHTVRIDLALLN